MIADHVGSPADFAELCEEVKAGIYEVLEETLIPAGAPQPGEQIPLLKNRRIVDQVPKTYATKLESDRHLVGDAPDQTKRIHIFWVGFGGIDTSIPSQTVTRKTFRLRFLIDSYYEDDIGLDDDNAEKRHASEVHKVAYALFASKVLKRPSVVEQVLDFEERRGFVRVGERMTRESLGEVFVKLKAVPLVKPA